MLCCSICPARCFRCIRPNLTPCALAVDAKASASVMAGKVWFISQWLLVKHKRVHYKHASTPLAARFGCRWPWQWLCFCKYTVKYGHCFFIRQFGDICVQIKHLRRRFPTVWAARHYSPGRTMMQNGPSDVAERAISQCQTGRFAAHGVRRALTGGACGGPAVAFLQGGLAVAAWRGLWPRGPAARCPAHNVWVFCCPGAWGVTALK